MNVEQMIEALDEFGGHAEIKLVIPGERVDKFYTVESVEFVGGSVRVEAGESTDDY
jgi:hypothetical protein